MLLPITEEQEEEDDPKERLVNRLILYQQYKDQIETFKELEEERNNYYTKVPSSLSQYQENDKKIQIENVSLDDLVLAFQKFLERIEMEKPVNTKVTKKEISVEDRIVSIKKRFQMEKRIDFFDLFEIKTKEYVVVTFLAILEMAKNHQLRLLQDENFENIICEAV